MISELQQILSDQYALKGNLTPLGADQDINFKLATEDGNYLVKITSSEKQRDFVQAQNKLLKSLESDKFQKPLPSKSGSDLIRFPLKDDSLPLRVFPFIEGTFLAEINPEISFYYEFGSFLANLDIILSGYQDPVLRIQTHSWAPERIHELTSRIKSIRNPEIRRIVRYFLMKHREEVLPVYHLLPKSLIHADANDHNVLVEDNQVKGLIDFGDMVYSARIHEISIALAYALMDQDKLVNIAEHFVKGYHEKLPLTQPELTLLYYLVPARLATSLIHAATNLKTHPTNEYHQISTGPAERLIKQWLKINPNDFINRMLSVCGLADPIDPEKVRHETAAKVDKRSTMISKSLSISYKEPIQMIGSALQYMYAADGKTYVDGVNNIPHVGHCHPHVVRAGQKQMARLNTNTRYIYDSLNDYAEKLLATFPSSLSKVFFVNSGSAATDLAIRLAKTHTGGEEFIVLDHAYHGNTQSAIAVSPYKFNRKGGQGKPESTSIIEIKAYGLKSKSRDEVVSRSKRGATPNFRPGLDPGPVSPIFIAESIPGCAGQVMLDEDFLQFQIQQVREAGGVYIADEVQTGFGRVGKHFWGFELYDVVPDIVILGKPIANGHPMGAVVCTEEIAASFETGMEFFSSFGGNPVSCEIATTVLEVIEEEDLQQHAREIGEYLLKELKQIQNAGIRFTVTGLRKPDPGYQIPDTGPITQTTYISDVRGSGLFLGIELVKDLKTMEPDAEAATNMVNYLKENGFLLSTDGPDENVIKFKPPMCFSMENAEELVEIVGEWGMGIRE